MSAKLKFLWWFSLGFKLVLSAIIPISLDEAYYWVWSKNLQLSYFDHPGMVAWLFKLGAFLEPLGQAVRWPAVILGHLTILVWIFIFKDFQAKEDKILAWLILALFSPLLGFGSLIVTPDLPVVFFWSLSLYFFQRHLLESSVKNSVFLGASLGLGFLSKYHIVLFIPAALLYLFVEKKWRFFPLKNIFIVVFFGLLFSLPVLIWNYQNDFSSFLFQIHHGLGKNSWDPFWTYSFPLGQLLLLFPIPIWLALKAKLAPNQKFLIYFSAVPLVFFFLSSFRGLVEMNWPIIAYPSFYALSALGAQRLRPIYTTAAIWCVLGFSAISFALFLWTPNMPEKFSEFKYFNPTLKAKSKYSPLYAESYQMASYLWYVTKSPTYKLREMSRIDFFDRLPESVPNQKVFFVVMDRDASFPPWILEDHYKMTTVEDLSDRFVVNKLERENL